MAWNEKGVIVLRSNNIVGEGTDVLYGWKMWPFEEPNYTEEMLTHEEKVSGL